MRARNLLSSMHPKPVQNYFIDMMTEPTASLTELVISIGIASETDAIILCLSAFFFGGCQLMEDIVIHSNGIIVA